MSGFTVPTHTKSTTHAVFIHHIVDAPSHHVWLFEVLLQGLVCCIALKTYESRELRGAHLLEGQGENMKQSFRMWCVPIPPHLSAHTTSPQCPYHLTSVPIPPHLSAHITSPQCPPTDEHCLCMQAMAHRLVEKKHGTALPNKQFGDSMCVIRMTDNPSAAALAWVNEQEQRRLGHDTTPISTPQRQTDKPSSERKPASRPDDAPPSYSEATERRREANPGSQLNALMQFVQPVQPANPSVDEQLDNWKNAKRARDYKLADSIQADLRTRGVHTPGSILERAGSDVKPKETVSRASTPRASTASRNESAEPGRAGDVRGSCISPGGSYWCKVCAVRCGSRSNSDAHEVGKKHKLAVVIMNKARKWVMNPAPWETTPHLARHMDPTLQGSPRAVQIHSQNEPDKPCHECGSTPYQARECPRRYGAKNWTLQQRMDPSLQERITDS